MRFTRWDPLQELIAMSGRLPRAGNPLQAWEHSGIRAEVRIEDDTLTQRREREPDTDFNDENAYPMGRDYGANTWSISLPPKAK